MNIFIDICWNALRYLTEIFSLFFFFFFLILLSFFYIFLSVNLVYACINYQTAAVLRSTSPSGACMSEVKTFVPYTCHRKLCSVKTCRVMRSRSPPMENGMSVGVAKTKTLMSSNFSKPAKVKLKSGDITRWARIAKWISSIHTVLFFFFL